MATIYRDKWRAAKRTNTLVMERLQFRDALGPSIDKLVKSVSSVDKPINTLKRMLPKLIAEFDRIIGIIDKYIKAIDALQPEIELQIRPLAREQKAMVGVLKEIRATLSNERSGANSLLEVLKRLG
jgi:hypothetical protein